MNIQTTTEQGDRAFVKILSDASKTGGGAKANQATAEVTVKDFPLKQLVMISAWGIANHQTKKAEKEPANAGIKLELLVDGELVSLADSYEAQSVAIDYRAAVSHNKVLDACKAAKIEARVLPNGPDARTNTATRVTLNVISIPAI